MDYIKIVKNQEVDIAALYLFEGEIMKIIVKQPEKYSAGDEIACSYSDITFKTKILKKSENHIYVLVPEFYEQFPNNKRKHPRISVNFPAEIYHKSKKLSDIEVIDLSRKGIGFMTNNEVPSLSSDETYELKIRSNSICLSAEVMIRNFFEADYKRYGCEIKSIDMKNEYDLRKFILTEQLVTNMKNSNEQSH